LSCFFVDALLLLAGSILDSLFVFHMLRYKFMMQVSFFGQKSFSLLR